MSQKRQVQVSAVELQQEHRHDEESNNKCARGANGNDQQQQEQDPGLNVDCKESMNLPPPPMQDDDSIVAQFKPRGGQWELNDENINRIDPHIGETILHNYCKFINDTPLEVYRYLIEVKGCDIHVHDKDKDTPLHDALRYFDPNKGGDISVLHYLLNQRGIDGNIVGKDGYTLLHMVCKYINNLPLEIFQNLIENGGCDVNAQDIYNDTPLHQALEHLNTHNGGDINVWAYLINQKAVNVNIKNSNGHTLLHLACICNIPD
jgi:ankyrin repeat protein